MSKDEELLRLHNEVEDYRQTVMALLAFAAFVVHDGREQRPQAAFGFGRRMEASGKVVTPDLVAQKSSIYGVVAEAKKSLSQDTSRWGRHVQQLRKYDVDSLVGWWTENELVKESNVVMLIHQSRSRRFIRFLQKAAEEGADEVGPTTCVVEFNSSAETASYYFFRLEYGEIADSDLHRRLDLGVEVPLDKVLRSYPNVRYYDSEPPLELILTDLWLEFFLVRAAEAEYDEKLRAYKFVASVEEVTGEMQRAYGSGALSADTRSVEFPKKKWIRKAFDRLVQYRFALPPEDGYDLYEVHFRSFREDVLEKFLKLSLERRREDETPVAEGQIGLFPEEN